ncbi:hypothetical protein VTK26DRAFT_308 [Humicola hyalothermophila]
MATKRRFSDIDASSPPSLAFPTQPRKKPANTTTNTTATTTTAAADSLPVRVALLHLNTLLSSNAALIHTVRRFLAATAHMLSLSAATTTNTTTEPPTYTPETTTAVTDKAILAAFATSPSLQGILARLGYDTNQLYPETWQEVVGRYVQIYMGEGMGKLELAGGAVEMLREMREQGVKVVILAAGGGGGGAGTEEKGVAVAEGMLKRFGVREMVGAVAAVPGSSEEGGVEGEGEGAAWEELVRKWIRKVDGEEGVEMMTEKQEGGGKDVVEMEVALASRAVYDLVHAKRFRAKLCWVKGSEMEESELGGLKPDLVVEDLDGWAEKLFGKEEPKEPEVLEVDGTDDCTWAGQDETAEAGVV